MTKKSEFMTAYAAGKDAVKNKLGPRFYAIVAIGIVLVSTVLRWLAARH
jgi:hypothetical protein